MAPYREDVMYVSGEIIFTRTRSVLFVSDVALLRQTFALVLEQWTGLHIVPIASLEEENGLLADPDSDIVLAVVSVDTADGPDTGSIEHLHGLGLPVLAFGLEDSTDHLARALEAGANEAISLGAPVGQFVGKATQLAGYAARSG